MRPVDKQGFGRPSSGLLLVSLSNETLRTASFLSFNRYEGEVQRRGKREFILILEKKVWLKLIYLGVFDVRSSNFMGNLGKTPSTLLQSVRDRTFFIAPPRAMRARLHDSIPMFRRNSTG